MRLTFLGTSHGVPEADRKCSCTLVNVNSNYYFIDMGTGIIGDLRRLGIEPDEIKGVFITHFHGDHTNGLISFADLLSWYYRSADPIICLPKEQGAKVLKDWLTLNNSYNRELRFKTVSEGLLYDDGTLRVTAFKTEHCDPSFGFLLEAEGKSVLFTGDLSGDAHDIPCVAFERKLDLIVTEAAHPSPLLLEQKLQGIDTKYVVVSHVFMQSYAQELFEVQSHEHSYSFRIANDGLELSL